MPVKVITAPIAALTLAELRLHLRIDAVAGVHEDDTLITDQLLAAQAYAEHHTGASIGSQTLELALDTFPTGPIVLPQGPVTGVTSVSYIDTAGAPQTLDSALYLLCDYGAPARLDPAYGTRWPATLGTPNAVKVRYVAGSLPAAARAALLLIVGHLYTHRESVNIDKIVSVVPMGADALLDTIKNYA